MDQLHYKLRWLQAAMEQTNGLSLLQSDNLNVNQLTL